MYTQKDVILIKKRIVKYSLITAALMIPLIAAFCVLDGLRLQLPAMACAILLWCTGVFMGGFYIVPAARYAVFLRDMRTGLSREMTGRIVRIEETADVQDGVRVHPVHIQLDKDNDERIIYLNASKADGFAAVGDHVTLNCYGRHIREVVA